MEKTIAVHSSGLLRNAEGKFLFLKRSVSSHWEPGKWQLPGGKMEWGETPEETFFREVLEETGMVPTNVRFFAFDTMRAQVHGRDVHVVNTTFIADGDGEVVISSDHSDFAWCTPAEALEKLDLIPRLRVFLEEHFHVH